MNIHIDRADHIVLTIADIDKTVKFYQTVLGMKN
ncbi:VOC family protein [Legionella fallonii]|nr:VOC family protein [Legionella fallonii]